jgi:hypothetical protein
MILQFTKICVNMDLLNFMVLIIYPSCASVLSAGEVVRYTVPPGVESKIVMETLPGAICNGRSAASI